LWTKHVRQYDDGRADIWYNVTRDGKDGRGIAEIGEYYYVTSQTSINTPTEEDLAAIEAGSTPPSFLAPNDTTHYNDYGYKLAAIAINNKLQQLGYIE
jgi:hypothetical protein